MNLTRNIGLIILCGLLTTAQLNAQQVQSSAPATEDNYDPIVAALDSLVTLNHVVRFNSLESNCYDSNTSSSQCNIPTFSDEVYKDRMNKINSPIPLSYNQYVKGFIDLYAGRKRGLTQRAMGLANLYFPMYEEVMDKEGIPLEFKYLSIVESALNPIAVSRAGATGLWQFMYNTGLIYNLKVNSYTDERKDPYKATQAACQYFKDMYNIYGDWLLVIAAYNCGAGNVNRAIKRSGGKTNFWELMPYLPKETRGYVPAFIAVTYVMNYSREHNLYPVTPAYSYFEVDTIKVSQAVNFQVLSRLIDLPIDVISYLNPVYKRNLIPDAEEEYSLRLPTNKIALFMANEEAIFAQSTTIKPVLPEYASRYVDSDDNSDGNSKYETITKRVKKTHTVHRGETLASIADRYDCSSQEIKKINHLRSSHLKSGQRLQVLAMVRTKIKVASKEPAVAVVKTNSDSGGSQSATAKKDTGNTITANNGTQQLKDTTEQSSTKEDSTQESSETSGGKPVANNHRPKYIYHLVQPGDTLWNIAKRYEGVTVEMIKDINNLHDSNLKPGTRLKVIVNG